MPSSPTKTTKPKDDEKVEEQEEELEDEGNKKNDIFY